jgi:integrase
LEDCHTPPVKNVFTCSRGTLDTYKTYYNAHITDACMFLSGLRRSEIAALKPDCLERKTAGFPLD